MKKITFLLLVFVLTIFLCSCGENGIKNAENNSDTMKASQVTPMEESTSDTGVSMNQDKETTNVPTKKEDSYPPEGEYTEIILKDERYFLCKKIQSGFSENSEQYGIYDGKNKVWALEYAEYDTYDLPVISFNSHGDGVFGYKYSGYYGTRVFLSAKLGATFKIKEHVYNQDSIYFDDGKALVLISKDTKYENGTLTPNSELVLLDVYGNIEQVSIPGFEGNTNLYWYDWLPSANSSSEVYVRAFYTYINKNYTYYIYVYFYDTNEVVIIDNQEYASRMNSSGIHAFMYDDLLRLTFLPGDDGEEYFAEFDRDGNVITKATPMDDIYSY